MDCGHSPSTAASDRITQRPSLQPDHLGIGNYIAPSGFASRHCLPFNGSMIVTIVLLSLPSHDRCDDGCWIICGAWWRSVAN